MERIIFHVDMDYFFAQIEERENPHFRGKPIVVGADPKMGKGRGVVSSASYEARKYGIKSGMPISKAYQLCPNAIFLPVNLPLYERVSENIMEILKKYSDKFEQVSLDEAYLDLTNKFFDFGKNYEKMKEMAQKIKNEIFEKEKLNCSIGIGPNKLIAKIACEKAKPNGILLVKPERIKKFLDPLDIKEIPGIGPKSAEKLRKMGINKIKELKKLSKAKLKEIFGKVGEYFWERARGIDEEPVAPKEIIKSIGKQITFEKDTRNPELIFDVFEKILTQVYQELIENNFSFKTIIVICRYSGFETHIKSKTLKEKTQDFKILKKEAKKLLLKFLLESKKLIRLIGLRLRIC